MNEHKYSVLALSVGVEFAGTNTQNKGVRINILSGYVGCLSERFLLAI